MFDNSLGGIITDGKSNYSLVKKKVVYFDEPYAEKGKLDTFNPESIKSTKYVFWFAILDLKTCFRCREKYGKIYNKDEIIDPEPPLHYNCRCEIKALRSVKAGNATKNGNDGADYWIKCFGELPGYYVTKDFAYSVGWRDGKSLSKYAFGKRIFGGIYNNTNGHLPDAPGRIWYEADINYYEGKRNCHRLLLWSNDGLMFVTYDHYETFYEII